MLLIVFRPDCFAYLSIDLSDEIQFFLRDRDQRGSYSVVFSAYGVAFEAIAPEALPIVGVLPVTIGCPPCCSAM